MATAERPEFVDVGAANILTLMRMRRVVDPEAGFALEMELRDEVVNPFRSLHGGLLATLIECSAAGRVMGEGMSERILPSDMNIRFLSTVKVGPARAITKVLRRGRRTSARSWPRPRSPSRCSTRLPRGHPPVSG
jgi:uncharacterized protein (TIGR00369 family)